MSGIEEWPLLECLISEEWRNPLSLCQIIVARQAPEGHVGAAVFLVDLACLGLKNGFLRRCRSPLDYQTSLRSDVLERQQLVDCDIVLAAKVLEEGMRYAGELGFSPESDGRRALKILGDTDPGDCSEAVPLGGEDGRPCFIAGPRDNVPRILATLRRSVGQDGFGFAALAGPPPPGFTD